MAETYIVKQGDYLSKIAKDKGFGDWKIIYDHPENKEFKEKRPDPNIIFPGDEIHIPDIETKKLKVATGEKKVIKIKAAKEKLMLYLNDYSEEGMADKPFLIEIKDENPIEDTISKEGMIEVDIPSGCKTAKITIWDDAEKTDIMLESTLEIGHLDPAETNQGIQARLNSLDFACGKVDGQVGEKTLDAVSRFQYQYEVEGEDGQLGPKTIDKIVEVYGC